MKNVHRIYYNKKQSVIIKELLLRQIFFIFLIYINLFIKLYFVHKISKMYNIQRKNRKDTENPLCSKKSFLNNT